jgi:glucuronate isomerase
MGRTIIMDENRLFPSDPTQRGIARRLYGEVWDLPIVSPHGHTDPREKVQSATLKRKQGIKLKVTFMYIE